MIMESVAELVRDEEAGLIELRGVPVQITGVVWPRIVQDAMDATVRRWRMCEVGFFVEERETFSMVSVIGDMYGVRPMEEAYRARPVGGGTNLWRIWWRFPAGSGRCLPRRRPSCPDYIYYNGASGTATGRSGT